MSIAISYILTAVILGAVGQIMLKKGMNTMGALTLSFDGLPMMLFRIATNPWVVVGLTIYLTSTVFWLTALSRVDLSYAYPFASLSYAVMLVAAWRLFDEDLNLLRIVGTLVVCLGVLLISRS
ncbi:MAG: EamA family transporter [Caldilineaceae bacterium]